MGAVIESRPTEVVPSTESATILQVIERAAQNPAVNIDKMERLLKMHERNAGAQRTGMDRGASGDVV